MRLKVNLENADLDDMENLIELRGNRVIEEVFNEPEIIRIHPVNLSVKKKKRTISKKHKEAIREGIKKYWKKKRR